MSEYAERLGEVVRQAWVAYCRETGHTEKESHVLPWHLLGDWDKEADRRIGLAVANALTEFDPRLLQAHLAASDWSILAQAFSMEKAGITKPADFQFEYDQVLAALRKEGAAAERELLAARIRQRLAIHDLQSEHFRKNVLTVEAMKQEAAAETMRALLRQLEAAEKVLANLEAAHG